MIELRPLLVVTGTFHIEGGLSKSVRKEKSSNGPRHVIITEERTVARGRRVGNVVAARYMRMVRDLKILRTPYGVLVDPKNLKRVKDMIAQATIDVGRFNNAHTQCQAANTLLWEHLRGARLDAVTGWIDRRLRVGDEEVQDALPLLRPPQAA